MNLPKVLKALLFTTLLFQLSIGYSQKVLETFTIQGQLLDPSNNPMVGQGISYRLSNPDRTWVGSLQLLGVATDMNGKYSGVIDMTTVPIGEELFVNAQGTITTAPMIEIFINSGATLIAGPMPIHSVPTAIVAKRALNADNADKLDNKTISEVAEAFEYGYGVPEGGIIMYSGIIDGTLFDGTGKGVVGSRMENWALCNGSNNTPDLRGRFIVGRSDNSPQQQPGDGGEDGSSSGYVNSEGNRPEYTQVGGSLGHGGEYEVTLTAAQSGLPSHTHPFQIRAYSGPWGDDAVTSANRNTTSSGYVTGDTAPSTPQDAQEAHNNVPPFYVLAFLKRIN